MDYELESRTFVIPKETSSHSMEITVTPIGDEKDETNDGKNETIILGDQNHLAGTGADPTADLKVGDNTIKVGVLTIVLKDGADPDAPAPEEDAEEDAEPEPALALVDEETDVAGTVDVALSKDLPEVSGTSVDEDSEVEYLLSGTLPAGLSFDAEARTISGTPTAVGEATVEYIALVNGTNIRKSYTITISEAPIPDVLLEGITSTHTSVRENGGEASITLTVELEDAAGAGGEDVTLTIGTPTEGSAAHRDVDFDATLQGSITIAEGATSGTATLTVTPHDNTTADGHKAFGVEATSSTGHSAIVNIGISDNESASQGIALSVYPDEVSEGTSTDVTVTASLDGRASDSDVTVSISIGASSSATRDVDYSAVFDGGAEVTIAAGDISGSATVTITAASMMTATRPSS